jgi:hypothetical protein
MNVWGLQGWSGKINIKATLENLRELVIFTPVCDITVFKAACIVLAFRVYISIYCVNHKDRESLRSLFTIRYSNI